MKTAKKVLSFFLCALMLATSLINDGWSSLIPPPEASAMAGHEQKYNDTRVELDFNKNWSFGFTDDDAAYLKGFDDSEWEKVDLPHDFSMSQEFTTKGTEAESGNLPGGTGWYRKWFNLYEYYSGDRVILNFDGAYQHVYVYVNGKYVGENHYGYNSFSFEIADYLVCSNTVLNLIAVKVVNELPSSRWYSGSGLNRDVTLTIAGPVHVSLYGPRITTPKIEDGDGTAEATIKLHNCTSISKKVSVEATVLDSNHNKVSETVVEKNIPISSNAETYVTLSPKVNNPKLWTLDDPQLYKLQTIVRNEAGELIDEYHTTFGYRDISWDADKGFSLNGEYIKLKGVCLHHDQGALGAAQEYEAIYRQLVMLKEMGCNAIRTAHNSTSKIVINICNEIGMFVIEEFFDGWDASKNGNTNDFSKYFNETIDSSNKAIGAKGQKWYQYVIEHTILRDEHDPCIIAWDIGNELSGITGGESTENYAEIVQSINSIVETLDTSHVVLQGNNEPENSVNTMIDGYMDVIGGNYKLTEWVARMSGAKYDNRQGKPFVATESASAVSSRGVYYTMAKDETNKQISAYDTNWVDWGNSAAEAWHAVVTNDWFSGEFIWTGFDYIGEPTPWNDPDGSKYGVTPNSSYFGVVDTAGFEKDSYYLYRSLWNENDTTLHLVPGSWNSDKLYLENGYVNVAVYSNAAEIRLFLNGAHIATAKSTVNTTPAGYTYKTWNETVVDSYRCSSTQFYNGNGSNFYPQFKVRYAAGNLSVKAYDTNGNEITNTVGSETSVSGTATQIAANTWQNRHTYVANSADYIYIEYEARDADGNFMNDYNGTLNIKVDDSSARYATIIGVDNGNPATTEKYQQPTVIISDSEAKIKMFNGRALVILKTTDEEGTINITATATDNETIISAEGVTVTSDTETGIHLTDELDEVITQNKNPYQVTLYDEFEIVKYHIDQLEEPVAGEGGADDSGNTGDSEDTPVSDVYNIFLPSAGGTIPDGDYVIYNQSVVMSKKDYDGWGLHVSNSIYDTVASVGTDYSYESFNTDESNVFSITSTGNNTYYIKDTSNNLYLQVGYYNLSYTSTPTPLSITVNNNGSVLIYNGYSHIMHYSGNDYFTGVNISNANTNSNAMMWLYSKTAQSTPSEPVPDENAPYQIFLADSSSTSTQSIKDGEYVIFNQNSVLTTNIWSTWGLTYDSSLQDIVNTESDSDYTVESFNTNKDNVFVFTHQGNNTYYIQSKSTNKYFNFNSANGYLSISDTPQAVSVHTNDNGSIFIYSGNYFLYRYMYYYFYGRTSTIENASTNANYVIWLYSKPTTTSAPSVPSDTTKYSHYSPKNDYNAPIVDGEYVLLNNNEVLSGNNYGSTGVYADSVTAIQSSAPGSAYAYESFNTDEKNVYIFTSKGNGLYSIKNKTTGYDLYMESNTGNLYNFPNFSINFTININSNGSAYIRYGKYSISKQNVTSPAYFSGSTNPDENAEFWFYSLDTSEDSGTGDNESGGEVATTAKVALYNTLHDGIAEDFSLYTRASFEALLRALENGVGVFKAETSTDEDFIAATKAINDAIAALKIDIKQIDGTLFKYGYNNSSDTPDYSDGGTLMNDIAIRQMKTAILADSNLVNQIKNIIGYDTTDWEEGYAERAIEDIAEAYARIYTIQFSDNPIAGLNKHPNNNKASNAFDLTSHDNPPVTLWNLWTKTGTHGANDPQNLHDGASVQGLGSSSLEKDVIKSHSAYNIPLSYANDGPNYEHDITYYNYTISTGQSKIKSVRLDYLTGISVYFPDLFTRENLDANGNVTTATKGQFAKYYWDAQFPIFISTDEHGVNTYNFDSKDTTYIVQSDFNDAEHTVDMVLNEVDGWNANGSNSGSGFFPFNYKQGVSSYTGENAIYHYGFTFEHNFYIPKGGKHINGKDVIFNFSGDDDVYVYIDGVLVLDNGGLHGAREVTINFTECTINYQFAMDVTDATLKGGEYELTYSYNNYFENPDTCGYNADTIAALNKLHSVISDGQVHTLNFFYLERGSTDSNCRMSFNLSETSEEVRIIDQELTLDYGLSVEYNIQDNNNLSQAALDNNVKVEYLGLCAVNEEVETTYTFELPEIKVPFEEGKTYNVEGMKYGVCSIDKDGNTKYVLKSMNMSESEHFYVCAKITGDPTYAEAVTYYQIERTTFIPASTIYYEDTYDSVTYTDGKVPSNYDNSINKYGLWQEYGEQLTTLKQTADLTDSEANPYGYETNYASFAEYSGGSIHYVDVSTKNNPNKKYSGGEGAKWPTVDFTFTGTGFDLISITDNTTGAFSVTVKDSATGAIVRNTVVDTFYGYNYGRIYADADGKPTLDDRLTPMYRSENGTCTSSKRYYNENGAITDVPHYYDENDNVVKTETANPAYAYAYGWVVAEEGTTETLYQIPVIKITDLAYGKYNVTITPTFTSIFGHSSVNTDGTSYYRVYLDAIKIYSPAGIGDDIDDKLVKDAYATDDELYPDYLELKDMLIGAESLSETEEQGIIFIDGIAALDNDLDKYKNAGPNNELYLAKDQAVAFEIWATSVPTDIQLGAKLACGEPQLTISYDANTTSLDIRTAHDTFYSLNTVLPNNKKLTWHLVTGADGNKYYTTGTVVIQNTGEEDSVLSVTNLKWTFSQNGGKGYFRIPTSVENEALSVTATENTPMLAYSLMRMRTADLDIEQTEEPEIVTSEDGTGIVSIKFSTSPDVDSLVITDNNGNVITPDMVEKIAAELDGREVTEWLVTLSADKPGIYTYTVTGAYANGYVDYSKAITVTVTVENPPTVENPEDNRPEDEIPDEETDNSLFDALIRFFNRIIEFFRALFALFGVNL